MVSQTENLLINHPTANQNQKMTTISTGFDVYDGAGFGFTTIDLDGLSGNVTPDEDIMRKSLLIKTSGALAAACNIIVPTDYKKQYILLHNGTGFQCTIKTASGAGFTLDPGEGQYGYCDGVNVIGLDVVGAGGSYQQPEKQEVVLIGLGGTNDQAIGTNVNEVTVEVYASGLRLILGTDFSVTESVPASGNYDQLTPSSSNMFPVGEQILCRYYTGTLSVQEKTEVTLTGSGSTNDQPIGANVDPNTVDVFSSGIRLIRAVDFSVSESIPASGNYDQLTPASSDMFPAGERIQVYYYAP